MKKLCVIGDPIHHSLSPVIQNAMIAAAGLDLTYGACRVAGEDTARWLTRAKTEGYAGFNATMPHKENLLTLVDELSVDAARIGAVNTVCIRDGKVYGCNTDAEGVLRALREAGMAPEGKRVLVLGAGGAARAVVYKLVQAGAARVVAANRTVERAERLCGEFGAVACDFSADTLARYAAQSDLLVNCTNLGMTGVAGQFADLSFLEHLPAHAGVFDLIYSPRKTALLARAEQLGLQISNGLDMLIWQGVFALEHFANERLDEAALAAAARAALEELE
ncbi:MAG: shikimate dehydrogenase [Oscillospiraceae bacterium]|nr:shikimate dehydrogenase [Oscillospiraceae bacterium]